MLRIIRKTVKKDLDFIILPERDIEGSSTKVPRMAVGLPVGGALLAYPFSDMGLLMATHGKQEKPGSADPKAQRRRLMREKMDRMGLDPAQRRFIEDMMDDEEDGAAQDEAPSE